MTAANALAKIEIEFEKFLVAFPRQFQHHDIDVQHTRLSCEEDKASRSLSTRRATGDVTMRRAMRIVIRDLAMLCLSLLCSCFDRTNSRVFFQ